MKPNLPYLAFLAVCVTLQSSVYCAAKPDAPKPTVPNVNDITGGGSRHRVSPALSAKYRQANADYDDGAAEMRAKSYFSAEDSFNASLSNIPDGLTYLGLGEALIAQGKTKEALQTYWNLFHPGLRESWKGSYLLRAEFDYVVLLSENGRWAEAVAMYEKALPDLSSLNMTKIDAHFDPAVPQPTELQAAAHVGIGLTVTNGGGFFESSLNERAFSEYTKALKLAPNWPVANYYYGYGWQRLSPQERANLASQREGVKAALDKAAKMGTPDVSAAATAELKQFRQ